MWQTRNSFYSAKEQQAIWDTRDLIQFSDDDELEEDCHSFQKNHLLDERNEAEEENVSTTNVFSFGINWKLGQFGPIGSPPITPRPISVNSLSLNLNSNYANIEYNNTKTCQHFSGFDQPMSVHQQPSSPTNSWKSIIGSSPPDSGSPRSAQSITISPVPRKNRILIEKNNKFMAQSGTFAQKMEQCNNQVAKCRLHVSNIPFKYRREHLINMFSIFGEVKDSEIIFNERGSKGFGFVSFVDSQAADKAKKALHGLVIDGRKIEVNFATPRRGQAEVPSKKLLATKSKKRL